MNPGCLALESVLMTVLYCAVFLGRGAGVGKGFEKIKALALWLARVSTESSVGGRWMEWLPGRHLVYLW